jgi:hypothetical protein
VSSCSRRVSINWRKVQASSYSAGVWRDNAWKFLVPSVGWRVHVEDERLALSWVDGAWRDRLVGTGNGGAIRLVALEQELTLGGLPDDTSDHRSHLLFGRAPPPSMPQRRSAFKVRLVLSAMSFTAPAG